MWGAISLLGWGLFAYWWAAVVGEDPRALWQHPLVKLLGFLMALSLLTLVVTFGWISHNRRIARRGRRGMATRYRVPSYPEDALGRTVLLPQPRDVRAAHIVVVTADAETKTFTTAARPMT